MGSCESQEYYTEFPQPIIQQGSSLPPKYESHEIPRQNRGVYALQTDLNNINQQASESECQDESSTNKEESIIERDIRRMNEIIVERTESELSKR